MQEWMLMGTKPVYNSGFENDEFNKYATDSFQELLDTSPVTNTVILYNNDLSESKEILCIVQGRTADTQLKSMERTLLFPIGTVKAGMYVFFENRYWIIDGYPGNNGIYEKVTAKLCQYNLKWQLSTGEIVERWVNLMSASKYDIGESGGSTIVLSSNNYTVLIGYDEKALELEGKRVFIDKRDTKPTKVFKLTRNDDVLYDYGEHGSVLSFICDKGELNTTEDNQELRVCNYHSPTTSPSPTDPPETDETAVLSATINGNSEIKYGYNRTYTVIFTDKNGNVVDNSDFTWNVVSGFEVAQTVDGQSIGLQVDDENALYESFTLQVLNIDGTVMAEMEITVVDGF